MSQLPKQQQFEAQRQMYRQIDGQMMRQTKGKDYQPERDLTTNKQAIFLETLSAKNRQIIRVYTILLFLFHFNLPSELHCFQLSLLSLLFGFFLFLSIVLNICRSNKHITHLQCQFSGHNSNVQRGRYRHYWRVHHTQIFS